MSENENKCIQKVTGKFLFYGRAVDTIILTALISIPLQQSVPVSKTMKRVKQFLYYCASQEYAIMAFWKSDMTLAGHCYAGYLNKPKSRSIVGGHFFMSNISLFPKIYGAMLTIHQIIKAFMSSSAEAKIGALFINAREDVYMLQMLEAMGHKQYQTPIQTDNITVEGVINKTIQQKCTKSMDMRFHCIRDRES